ncbi:MAG: hypothetical protein K9I29_04700 [Bacteroidales bacterium]|nr:hypothetical protein [Bacteroidales bacterium]MCF8327572.1 hypothetical protein [Bacteroidales bacterium]
MVFFATNARMNVLVQLKNRIGNPCVLASSKGYQSLKELDTLFDKLSAVNFNKCRNYSPGEPSFTIYSSYIGAFVAVYFFATNTRMDIWLILKTAIFFLLVALLLLPFGVI